MSSSAMVKRLVRHEQVATSIGAHAMGFIDGASLGLVIVDVSPGADTDAIEAEVAAELEQFLQTGPSAELLEAVKAHAERAWLSALASGEERADLISHYTLLHDDPHYINTALDRLLAIPLERVHESARTWLRPEHRVCVAYLVEDTSEEAA